MKCPVCKGTGCYKKIIGAPEGYFFKDCPHCKDGRIELDSVWKGTVRGYKVFAVYTCMGWVIPYDEVHFVGKDFKPSCCMKDVE